MMANLSIINFEHVSKYIELPKLQNYLKPCEVPYICG